MGLHDESDPERSLAKLGRPRHRSCLHCCHGRHRYHGARVANHLWRFRGYGSDSGNLVNLYASLHDNQVFETRQPHEAGPSSIKANIFLSMFLTVTSLIAFSACEYTYFGLRDTSIPLDATHDGIVRDGVKSLYFSVVTWTTLGYGDFVPANDFTRFFAAWEALTGYVVMAVLVAALVSTFRSRPIQ